MQKDTFEVWMKRVDAIMCQKHGVTSNDIPDYGYADAYELGMSASGTALKAVKAAKDF